MSFLKKIDKKKNDKKKASEDNRPDVTIKSILSDSDDVSLSDQAHGERVLDLDTDKVSANPQVRTQFNDEFIAELAKSMKSRGQQLPITVSEVNESGFYIIQDGECRWRAAKIAGIRIKAVVRNTFESDQDRIFDQLVANIQRDDLRPLAISKSINDLKELGAKPDEIAEQLGKSKTYIYRYAKLADLPKSLLDLCHAGVVNDVITLENIGKLHSINPERAEALCKSALEEGITRKQSDRYLKEAKETKIENEEIANQSLDEETKDIQSYNSDFRDIKSDDSLLSDIDEEGFTASTISDDVEEEQAVQPEVDNVSLGKQKKERPTTKSDSNFKPKCYQVESVGISVKVDNSKEPCVLCLDRIDDDADYVWVEFENGLSRVHKNTIQILSIFEK